MAQVAVGVTLGTPNSAGEIPITTSNLAASIAQAVTDTTTLATAITAAQGAATTADTNTGTVQSDVGTADTAAGTLNTNIATTLANLDTFAAAIIAITGDTYVAHQFVFGGATGLTHAQVATTFALLNTAITALLTAQTQGTLVKGDTATAVTDAATAKAATAVSKVDALALSTTAIATDHTNAQAIVASANVLVQTDDSVVTNMAALNGALVSALTFCRKNNILPT